MSVNDPPDAAGNQAAVDWALESAPIPMPTPAGKPGSPAVAAVLFPLALYCAADGTVRLPVEDIAWTVHLSPRTIVRCVDYLVELGILERLPGDDTYRVLYQKGDTR